MRYLLKPVTIVALLGCLPACFTTSRPIQLSPEEAAQKSEVRVNVARGDRIQTVYLRDPQVTSDSIVGKIRVTHRSRGRTWHTSWGTWAAPLSAVVSLETLYGGDSVGKRALDAWAPSAFFNCLANGIAAVALTAFPRSR